VLGVERAASLGASLAAETKRREAEEAPRLCVLCADRGEEKRIPWWNPNDACEPCIARWKRERPAESLPKRGWVREGVVYVMVPGLRRAMAEMKTTGHALARRVGARPNAVSRWANGKTACPLPVAERMASDLGVSVEELKGEG